MAVCTKSNRFFLYLFFTASMYVAQSPSCPSTLIYSQSSSSLLAQAVSPTLSPSNLILNNLPLGASGFAIGPAFSFPAPNPTFWTTAGGTFWYYDGANWNNTGHSTGNLNAVNIGGGGSLIFNLVGSTGDVYVYNGTGTATLVTTVSSFGGPWDIVSDDNNNFYLLSTSTATGQAKTLSIYDQTGSLLCSYNLVTSSSMSTGTGFSIINNMVYDANNGGLVGTIVPGNSTITFSSQTLSSGSDWANCSLPVPSGSISAPNGTVMNCNLPNLSLIGIVVPGGIGMDPGPASSTLTSSNYTWSGPGVVAGQNTASITVNQAGIYTFSVYSSGCPAQLVVQSITVTNTGFSFTPTITVPAGCFYGNMMLSASLSISTSTITWWKSNSVVGVGDTIFATSPGTYSVLIINTAGCIGTATANVIQPPPVGITLSSTSVCAQPSNNSPFSITLTPSGASTYTLLTSPNYSVGSTWPWVCVPTGAPLSIMVMATATLIGSNGTCTNATSASFSVIPNPTINLTPPVANVCSGSPSSFTASGASSFFWLPVPGLNNYSNNTVFANSLSSTTYSAFGMKQGCYSKTASSGLTVLPLPVVVANSSVSTICLGNSLTLTASGSSSALFTWYASQTASPGPVLGVNPLVATTYTVKANLNSCISTATAFVNVVPPPVTSLMLSSTTLCAQPFNNSPISIALLPSGATAFTLLTSPNLATNTPFGPTMSVFSNAGTINAISVGTLTLLGSNGFCSVSTTKTLAILPNPVIFATPAVANICPENSQMFTVSGATSYTWQSNGSGLSAYVGNSVMANPSITTVYSVFGGSVGCNSGSQISILNVLPVPSVTLTTANPMICSGSQANLTALANSATYTWIAAPGLFSASGANALVNPISTQNYTVIASNSCTNSAVITISVISSPSITAAASEHTICKGASVHMYASGGNSYSWQPATGSNATYGSNILATPDANTTFTVWGSNGVCTGSTTLLIKTIPIPDVQISANANQVCVGYPVTIKATGADAFFWYPTANISSNTGSGIIANPVSTTNYTIIGVNSSGTVSCSQQVSYSVIVIPTAKALVSNNVAICEGTKTTLRALGGNTYQWLPVTGLNKTSESGVVAGPSVSTVYTVEVSYNGYCGSSNTVQVVVNPNPVVWAGRDTSFNLDEPMAIHARGTGTLTWLNGEGIICHDCPYTRIATKINSCYVIEAANSFGCKVQDEVCVTVTDNYGVYLPNSFTPNKDGLNDVFFIYGTGLSEVTLGIYDRWGQQLFASTDQANGWDGTYKGIDCLQGAYVYTISYKGLDGKKTFKTGPIVLYR